MAHGDYHEVPFVNNVYAPISLYEDSAWEAYTHNGHAQVKEGWAVLKANPEKYLAWVKTAEFGNINPDGDWGEGFRPSPLKMARLDSLKQGQRGKLEITVLYESQPGFFNFVNGRHRAYWLATHQAVFVPLTVPKHQFNTFECLFL
ncbi:hypothetical protein [Bordetella sp. FB-8]|uniref:hypothetical protein n=1 Tax=Bordetella sp. FB-8 TaxID=1159870 RepID=UPI0003773A15|nr:hypothetical protein [Bordetella sp. FB-8]